ncbi:hypothetical protein AB0X64_00935 [Limosilactobacillus vaginalis]|uniref:Lreu_0056 family protein n=1 Tax=Limosilactobacillus vaginalis TaxID=1633 RepID=UPI003F1F2663
MKRQKIIKFLGLVVVVIGIGVGGAVNIALKDSHNEKPKIVQETSQKSRLRLNDQQLSILVGLAMDPKWLTEQLNSNQLVYGVVKPSDTVPKGIGENESFLIAAGERQRIIYFSVNEDQTVEIKDSQNNQIRRKKEVTVRQLVRRFYQTSKQQQQVNELVSELRTE